MKCPKCNKDFDINNAEISANILDPDVEEKELDIQVNCPHCQDLAFFGFMDVDDLAPDQ